MTKIYTKVGDSGYTIILKKKVSKDSLLVDLMGEIDELNSFLGLAWAACDEVMTGSGNGTFGSGAVVADILKIIQIKLFDIGAELSGEGGKSGRKSGSGKSGSGAGIGAGAKKTKIKSADILELEKIIDEIFEGKKITGFVRPGEKGEFSARVHVARAVCRRAERALVKVINHHKQSTFAPVVANDYKYVLQYLNRLSDLLFTIAELK